MIVGADISSYQGDVEWPKFKDNVNFVIIKATEGVSLIDTWLGNNRQQARDLNLPRGFYHFAHADLGNTPEAEAQEFINVMNGQPLQEGESVYLDYEMHYGGDNVGWVLKWMQIVEEALHVKPIFYSYQSMLTSYDWTPVVNNGNGLWVAAPTNDPNDNDFQTGAWKFAMMQQWGEQVIPGISGAVDADVFFGDADQFKAYGYHAPKPAPVTPQPSHVLVDQPVVTPSTITPKPVVNPVTPIVPVPETADSSLIPVSQPVAGTIGNSSPKKTHLQIFVDFINWLIGKKR